MASSLTITFKSVTTGKGDITIELDDEKNNGKTEFSYTDTAYFRVYADPGMNISVYATDGSISNEGGGVSTEKEFKEFIDSRTATTNKPISAIVSNRWYGNNLGSITKTGIREVSCTEEPDAASGRIGICEVEYTSHFSRYGLTIGQRDDKEYKVLVIVVGT